MIPLKELTGETFKNTEDYDHIVSDLPLAVYACDIHGKIIFYNKAAAELWGREPERGKDLWSGAAQIYRTDGSPLPLEETPMAITVKTRTASEGEEIIIERPDKSRRHVKPHPRPLFNKGGEFTGVISILIDVTEHRQSNQALEESEERLRMATEISGLGTWDLDIPKDVTITSEEHRSIFGYVKGSEWGKTKFMQHVHPEDIAHVENTFRESLTSGKLFYEARIVRPDKKIRWIRVNAKTLYDRNDKPIRMIGTVLDITDQKQIHHVLEQTVVERTAQFYQKNAELKRVEDQYHRMVDEIQDYAIILLSKDGTIQNWNKGAEKIKGYREEEIVGKKISVFYQIEDQTNGLPEKLLTEATTNGRAIHEGWRVRKDKSLFWGSTVITAVHDEQGNIVGFTKVTRDLTERKMAEDQLLRSARKLEQKNAELVHSNNELEQFAYVASHDLQEPLRKIQAFSSLLEKSLNDPTEAKKYFDKITSAASRMSVLIRDLLNYSKLSKSDEKLTPTDLNQVLKEVLTDFELLIREKEAEIHTAPLPVIMGIPHQLHQLFLNLISNALKFSRIPPVIEISSERILPSALERAGNLRTDKKYVQISVKDNGIGFDPQYSEKIFTIFQRLNTRNSYSGTGIGLALCRKIVENHHGSISAMGEPDKGAVFRVILPLE